MKTKYNKFHTMAVIFVMILSLSALASCINPSSQSSSFYDAGSNNFTATGPQFVQYFIYRFDTSATGCSFTIPDAADIISAVQSPIVGDVIVLGVTADGANSVTLIAGTNVTIKPSASTIAPNSTLTIYCVFDDVTSGNQAITMY